MGDAEARRAYLRPTGSFVSNIDSGQDSKCFDVLLLQLSSSKLWFLDEYGSC